VSDPHQPTLTGSVRIGGIVNRSPHPAAGPVNGGPQMVEVSRDGRRVYFTNGLYRAWDGQFYPDGIKGWMVKVDADPHGGIRLDPNFFLPAEEGYRTHQIRLEGGDSSSDTFCYS
jgi:selenium-binding protein 1